MFLTEKGLMRYLRTPMGISVSSDEFLARFYVILKGIPKIIMLIDDILIQTESLPELLFIMRLTLEHCRQYNNIFSLAKMEVASPGEFVTFADYRVSDSGFEPEKDRIRVITSYPQPVNLTDI